jgi:hypothetical protein
MYCLSDCSLAACSGRIRSWYSWIIFL